MNWIIGFAVIFIYFVVVFIIAQICGINSRLEELEYMHPPKED